MVEQLPLKQRVVGSSPARVTTRFFEIQNRRVSDSAVKVRGLLFNAGHALSDRDCFTQLERPTIPIGNDQRLSTFYQLA